MALDLPQAVEVGTRGIVPPSGSSTWGPKGERTMKSAIHKAIITSAIVLGALSAVAAPIGGGTNDTRRDISTSEQDRLGAPNLPTPPVDPTPQTNATPSGIQLVGFTVERIRADHGILNMTRLCQREFPGSRLCTVDDVLGTVIVPALSAQCDGTFAWVRTAGSTTIHDLLGSPAVQTVTGSRPSAQVSLHDCRGWTSAEGTDFGTVVALGSEQGCFGGFMTKACDQERSLACCAELVR